MSEPSESNGRNTGWGLLLSRWLMVPFVAGLLCLVVLLTYRFVADLVALAMELTRLDWRIVTVGVLNLVVVYLTVNLVLIVGFYIYGTFIRRIGLASSRSRSKFLIQRNGAAFLKSLMWIIAAIAALKALVWYLNLGTLGDSSKIGWAMAFPLMFFAGMVLLAIAHRLGRDLNRRRS